MRDAIISECGTYRYGLRDIWRKASPLVLFIALNPSIADADKDDHTSRKFRGFAQRWGFGGWMAGNLYAVRETDRRIAEVHDDPVGPRNDFYLEWMIRRADTVVAAWGASRFALRRAALVQKTLLRNVETFAIKHTSKGCPQHPLMAAYTRAPIPYKARA